MPLLRTVAIGIYLCSFSLPIFAQASDADLWGDSAPTTAAPVSELSAAPWIEVWEITGPRDLWRQPPPTPAVFEGFRQGAVDFWVKYDPQWIAEADRGTLVTYSNGYETLFEIAMAPAGDGILFSNGSGDGFGGTRERSNFVAADFTDGRFHHVSAITEGDRTQIFVDGRLAGTASVGYGNVADASGTLQLSIGSLDGRRRLFQGQIGAVRIWAAPLPAETLLAAAFVRDQELLNIPWAQSFLIAHIDNRAGATTKPQLSFLPTLFRAAGVWMKPSEIRRQQNSAKRAPDEPADWTFTPRSYVQVVMAAPDSELVTHAATAPGSLGFAGEILSSPGGGQFRRVANAAISGHNRKQVTGSVRDCLRQCEAETSFRCVSVDYHKGKNRCDLSDKRAADVGGLKENYPGDPYEHYERLTSEPAPDHAVSPTSDNATLPMLNAPAEDSPLAVGRPSGSVAEAPTPVLVWLAVEPQGSAAPERINAQLLEPIGRNRYRSASGDEIQLTSPINMETASLRLERVDRPERPPRQDEPRIDNAYMVGNQVRNRQTTLHGWDPLALNPFDFSKPEGGQKAKLFVYPPYGYELNARMAVPKGLELIDLQSGEGRRKHTEVTTESKMQRELGVMVSVGGSVDVVKGAAAFSANGSFKGRTEKLRQGTSAFTLAQATNRRFALLLDKPNIGLAMAFRNAVESAARQPSVRSALDLVNQFGTHYAHAIVMGGRITEIVELDSETWGIAQLYEGGVGGAVEARVGFADAANAKAKFETQMSASQYESFNASVTNSKESWEYSGGAGGASAGMWQVQDDTVAPIFLDLRPISELLAPPFFTDPAVFATLRPLVNQAIIDYVAQNAGAIEVTERFVPKRITYEKPKEIKGCARNKTKLRHAFNTDSKREGGGAWAYIELPKAESGKTIRLMSGCKAHSHGDGWLDAKLECNRVCWSDFVYTCQNGTWKRVGEGKIFSHDRLCNSKGDHSQDYLYVGEGNAPW